MLPVGSRYPVGRRINGVAAFTTKILVRALNVASGDLAPKHLVLVALHA